MRLNLSQKAENVPMSSWDIVIQEFSHIMVLNVLTFSEKCYLKKESTRLPECLMSENISYLRTLLKVIGKRNFPYTELQRKSNLSIGVWSVNFGEFFRKHRSKERKYIKCNDCSPFSVILFLKF